MQISFSKIKSSLQEDKEARYGQFFDLEMHLERLSQEKKELDGEEALLRFLLELSKTF